MLLRTTCSVMKLRNQYQCFLCSPTVMCLHSSRYYTRSVVPHFYNCGWVVLWARPPPTCTTCASTCSLVRRMTRTRGRFFQAGVNKGIPQMCSSTVCRFWSVFCFFDEVSIERILLQPGKLRYLQTYFLDQWKEDAHLYDRYNFVQEDRAEGLV